MGKVSRFAALFVAMLATVVLAAGPASAHVTQIELNNTGTINPDGSVTVSGTITCTAGEQFTVRVNIQQKDPNTGEETYRGRGLTKGTCTGSPQGWTVTTSRNSGTPTPGPASATAKGWTADQQPSEGRKDTEVIQLV